MPIRLHFQGTVKRYPSIVAMTTDLYIQGYTRVQDKFNDVRVTYMTDVFMDIDPYLHELHDQLVPVFARSQEELDQLVYDIAQDI